MNIADAIRSHTIEVRDAIANIESQVSLAEGHRDASEERVKRASTEITKQRTLEDERKRSLNAASEKVAEAQRILEELERKRQDALDALIRCQDEEGALSKLLREAQEATGAALAEIKKEQRAKQEAESNISELRDDLEKKRTLLRRKILDTLEEHLKQQTDYVMAAFATHEQRQKVIGEREALRRARHTDSEVARLCDEKDEVKKLLSTAMVPGVKEMLLTKMKIIEAQLQERFPGAFQFSNSDVVPRDNQIEELLFYCDRDGKAVFLLPIRSDDWDATQKDEPTDDSTKAMCIVWNMIRELGLKTRDGNFLTGKGRVSFASRFDLEEVAILQTFGVKFNNLNVLRFILTAVPAELQEALSYG